MNSIPKVVFSKTLTDDEATWPESRVARGELAAEIAAIKAKPGADVIVCGAGLGWPVHWLRRTSSTNTAYLSNRWSWAVGGPVRSAA